VSNFIQICLGLSPNLYFARGASFAPATPAVGIWVRAAKEGIFHLAQVSEVVMRGFRTIEIVSAVIGAMLVATAGVSSSKTLNEADALEKRITELDNAGKYTEAIPLAERVLAIREKALGPNHPSVASSLNNLGMLYASQGHYADAELLHQRSLAIREKALGPYHPDVAQSLNSLASLYDQQGRYPDAEPLYKRSLAIREKTLGPDHPDVAQSLNNLALLYKDEGRYADAEPFVPAIIGDMGKGARPRSSRCRQGAEQSGSAV
jgi:tetratricopeptide (TPR) repeat protein